MKQKLLSVLLLSLAALPALAVDAPAVRPQVDTDPTALIVSAVLLFGMIGWFFWYVFLRDRSKGKGD